jgi:nucleotide-binding universal stress UspA family protein
VTSMQQPRRPDDEQSRRLSRWRQDRGPAAERAVTPSGELELGTDGPGAIVVGVDGTPTSLRALAYAAGLARRQRAELLCVYVKQPLRVPVAMSGWVDAGIVAAESQAQSEVEKEIWEQVADDASTWGTGARIVVRAGNPLTELRKVAEQTGADTIIVGASASLGHRLFGSLGHRLLRRKPCPVTIVP